MDIFDLAVFFPIKPPRPEWVFTMTSPWNSVEGMYGSPINHCLIMGVHVAAGMKLRLQPFRNIADQGSALSVSDAAEPIVGDDYVSVTQN